MISHYFGKWSPNNLDSVLCIEERERESRKVAEGSGWFSWDGARSVPNLDVPHRSANTATATGT